MKLSQLLYEADVEKIKDVEISFVTDKIQSCKEGCAFVCIEGKSFDGHDYAREALEKSAAVLITQKDTCLENQIIVPDSRKAYALMCSRFFGEPSKKLRLIGVTGTNGKTTVASALHSLLTLMGKKAGLIGTVETVIGSERTESTMTTPDAYEFNRRLALMAEKGVEYCVCEVSSQALDQKRVWGCEFEIGVFTNITNEHLDYHESFENYLEAKKKLFSQCRNAIINLDGSHSGDIISSAPCEVMTFSVKNDEADLNAKSIKLSEGFCEYAAVTFSKIARVKFEGIGLYSVSNSLAALAVMMKLGFEFESVCEKMKLIEPPRGRGERISSADGFSVIIDYAHTPDALYNILSALSRERRGRLIVLFGCGGDRDREKRPEMGRVVSSYADIAVVTDDNPRNESENEIISDILSGMDSSVCRIYVEKDRSEAIRLALSKAKKNDIVLLAGKGHEAYQIIKNKKTPFDEREKVAAFFR